MRTILYNLNTNKPISKIFENGYNIPIPETFVKEIEVIDTPMPTLESNQYANSHYEYLNGKWVKVWEAFTIEVEPIVWHEETRSSRFFMFDEQYVDLMAAYPEMSLAFAQANLPIHKADGGRYIYYSILYPEHKALLASFGADFQNKP